MPHNIFIYFFVHDMKIESLIAPYNLLDKQFVDNFI